MHLLQSTPPNGLSGLFFVFAMDLILYGSSLGTPFRTAPQFEHSGAEGFFLLYCTLTLPPGTFLKTFLRLLDLNLGAGMRSGKVSIFIKLSIMSKIAMMHLDNYDFRHV